MTKQLRYPLGQSILCNMGSSGWHLGTIIALHYREDDWPPGQTAPYQVVLDADRSLIYVPEDDARYCRAATAEDRRIARRPDALAALPDDEVPARPDAGLGALRCTEASTTPARSDYRRARCQGCNDCPCSWSAVELYSEHYRCATRNGLEVTRHTVDLGTFRVGDALDHSPDAGLPRTGFLQCPTRVRLPPGVRILDDGALKGQVEFDPHRASTYRVQLVAVSAASWETPSVGLVRLEITFDVQDNVPPPSFDLDVLTERKRRARAKAEALYRDLVEAWEAWEDGVLNHRDTCERMCARLQDLRALLEEEPRLDGGWWWVQLGGFHMNVHKLLENTLFECELYLGHALTFGDPEVRRQAEQNLAGCYQKRKLEAARFLWIDGLEHVMDGAWEAAAQTLHIAGRQQDGWGWAVNNGDIWISEAAARLVRGAELEAQGETGEPWIAQAAQCLQRGIARSNEGGAFGPQGHPWAADVTAALTAYRSGENRASWLEAFKLQTTSWCARVLGGTAPFPPKLRPRREDAASLLQRMPTYDL
ncbi:MAG: hypothetical protein AAGA54_17920 [Myxococcota bacterium]